MPEPISTVDPCLRYQQLRVIFDRLMTGQAESEVEYQGNGVTRRARFTQANLAELRREMLAAKDECALIQGEPRARRFAITGGFRSR